MSRLYCAVVLLGLRDLHMGSCSGNKPCLASNSFSSVSCFPENAFAFSGWGRLIVELQLGSLLPGLFLINALFLLLMLGICLLPSMITAFRSDGAFCKP